MMPVAKMTLEEVNFKLLRAFRNGLLSTDLKGFVLGFARSMKSQNPRCPSQKQVSVARRLVAEIRRADDDEPLMLIDREDMG